MNGIATLLSCAILSCANMIAQGTQRVNPDLSVTYSVAAPDANDVRLADDVFSQGPPGLAMTKGPDGIWTVSTLPYEAGTHQYGFVLDGVPTGDLSGGGALRDRMPRPFYPFELINVRASEPLFHDLQQVPHGSVHIETFHSALLGRDVLCYVYTPPGYEGSGRPPYGALYLLHGLGNEASHWTTYGYAHRIADNLIAAGEAQGLVIVMPDTGDVNHANQPADLVEHFLLEEVIPFAEQKYRIVPSPAARYLAGFSAGAVHTRNIGFRHPEMFIALGMMSGGGLNGDPPLETTYPKLMDAPGFNTQVRFVYLAIGMDDNGPNAVRNTQILKDSLDRLGITNVYSVTTGGHYFFNWRRYLAEFLKGLSRASEM